LARTSERMDAAARLDSRSDLATSASRLDFLG